MFLTLLKGFSISGSLIVAIGAQNAFVIRQGLQRRHLFLTALLCSLIDGSLIVLGVLGFGHVILLYPVIVHLAKYFAIAFLVFYGIVALKSACQPNKSLRDWKGGEFPSKKRTAFLILALSLLNPHVYLDTVILLGSIASQQPVNEQAYFAMGAITASFVWFFALTYGSRLLASVLNRPGCWRMIDSVVAVTMWGLAATLITRL